MLSDRDYTKAPFRQAPRRRDESVLKPLIIANVVVYILQNLSDPSGNLTQGLTPLLSLDYASVRHGQVWRLFTYMFTHGGFWHIVMNMWGLWIFGGLVERIIGGRKLLHLFLISGFVGGAIWLMFNHSPVARTLVFNNNIPMPKLIYPSSVGASGSVFGLLVSAALLEPNRLMMLLFPPIPMKLKTFALFYGLMEAFNTINQGGKSNIAHLAHLGGMLGGYLYMRWIFRGRWANVSHSGPGGWQMPTGGKPRWDLFKKKKQAPPPPMDYSAQGDPMKEVDAILDKIGQQGLGSLTDYERQVLQQVREKLKKKHR